VPAVLHFLQGQAKLKQAPTPGRRLPSGQGHAGAGHGSQPFASVQVDEFYIEKTPRTHGYLYRGVATK